MTSPKITPHLWFDTQAEEAADFYAGIFPDAKKGAVTRWGAGGPVPEGTPMTVTFWLNGQEFRALNAGPVFRFNEAISFMVDCDTQEQIDHYWDSLAADGGAESQCGWLKDKYGLSWQIIPKALGEMATKPAGGNVGRMMQAMMGMKKLDIAALTAAYEGR